MVTESVLLIIAGGFIDVTTAMLLFTVSTLSLGAEIVTIAFTASFRLAITRLIVSAIAEVVDGIPLAIRAA